MREAEKSLALLGSRPGSQEVRLPSQRPSRDSRLVAGLGERNGGTFCGLGSPAGFLGHAAQSAVGLQHTDAEAQGDSQGWGQCLCLMELRAGLQPGLRGVGRRACARSSGCSWGCSGSGMAELSATRVPVLRGLKNWAHAYISILNANYERACCDY